MSVTLKQATNRMLGIHRRILESCITGAEVPAAEVRTHGDLRGFRRAYSTLLRWGAIEDGKATDFGRELVALYDERAAS